MHCFTHCCCTYIWVLPCQAETWNDFSLQNNLLSLEKRSLREGCTDLKNQGWGDQLFHGRHPSEGCLKWSSVEGCFSCLVKLQCPTLWGPKVRLGMGRANWLMGMALYIMVLVADSRNPWKQLSAFKLQTSVYHWLPYEGCTNGN